MFIHGSSDERCNPSAMLDFPERDGPFKITICPVAMAPEYALLGPLVGRGGRLATLEVSAAGLQDGSRITAVIRT